MWSRSIVIALPTACASLGAIDLLTGDGAAGVASASSWGAVNEPDREPRTSTAPVGRPARGSRP
jgi:hypothetical protein